MRCAVSQAYFFKSACKKKHLARAVHFHKFEEMKITGVKMFHLRMKPIYSVCRSKWNRKSTHFTKLSTLSCSTTMDQSSGALWSAVRWRDHHQPQVSDRDRKKFWRAMWHRCKVRNTKAGLNLSAGQDVTPDDFENRYNQQKHKCIYSRITMIPMSHTNFQASIERLDEAVMYTKSNFAFCCLEFNTQRQWTRSKINDIPRLVYQPYDPSELMIKLRNHKRRKRRVRKIASVIKSDGVYYQCLDCLQFLHVREFPSQEAFRGCKSCNNRCMPPWTYVRLMVKNSKNRYLWRKKRHAITSQDIIEQVDAQKGRCYLSLIPMKFIQKSDFQCSIERINNRDGYNVDNFVLICLEFNTVDHSSYAKKPVYGSGQWNIYKMDIFLRTRFGDSFADYVWCLRHFIFHKLLSQ